MKAGLTHERGPGGAGEFGTKIKPEPPAGLQAPLPIRGRLDADPKRRVFFGAEGLARVSPPRHKAGDAPAWSASDGEARTVAAPADCHNRSAATKAEHREEEGVGRMEEFFIKVHISSFSTGIGRFRASSGARRKAAVSNT
ncbi:hypothetical protein EYF80_043896 [Liparis tanakae]|uniref:Uncharacterized protein n=1 Tax=Liparis tanakae TaxID=230148 RepID=A0A4Z2FXA8_9TELE|nr:hypothetical protein EYF80_043896 [Liparis tanakae]